MPTLISGIVIPERRLVTAIIFYRIPDHISILTEFIWQYTDVIPDFPRLFRFLNFWEDKIEGPLSQVDVYQSGENERLNPMTAKIFRQKYPVKWKCL